MTCQIQLSQDRFRKATRRSFETADTDSLARSGIRIAALVR